MLEKCYQLSIDAVAVQEIELEKFCYSTVLAVLVEDVARFPKLLSVGRFPVFS